MMLAVTTSDGSTSIGVAATARGEQRRDRPSGDLQVEVRQPPPCQDDLHPVDEAGRHRGGDRDHRPTTEEDADGRGHDHPRDRHGPAREGVAERDDRGHPRPREVEVGLVGEDVTHEVVDRGEVLVVDVALLDVAHHERRYVVERALVAHRQGRERHVDLGRTQAQVVGHRAHRRGHVRGARARGQEHLPDAQAEVHRQVDLAGPFGLEPRLQLGLGIVLVGRARSSVLLVHRAMVTKAGSHPAQG